MLVTKRNGISVPFRKEKLASAIAPALNGSTKITVEAVVEKVIESLPSQATITAAQLDTYVESAFIEVGVPEAAASYATYRLTRMRIRNEASDVSTQVQKIISADVAHENANKDARLFHVQRDRMASAVAKAEGAAMYPKELMDAHHKGQIHLHDLDYSPSLPFTNCCVPDFPDLLANGFTISDANLEPARSVGTACSHIEKIILAVSSAQYGGTTVDDTDRLLEPFVQKSYQKHLNRAVQFVKPELIEQYAKDVTSKEIYDAIQALVYNFNTTVSTQGQTPFLTIGFGMGTSWAAREVQKAILAVQTTGLGKDGRTPVFPKLIFSLRRGVNLDKDDPNYDIKQLALACSTKRIYPDVLLTENMEKMHGVSVTPMGCVDGDTQVTYQVSNIIQTKTIAKVFSGLYGEVFDHPDGISQYKLAPERFFLRDSATGIPRWTKCKLLMRRKEVNWIKVDFAGNDSITVSLDHPFPTKDGRVTASDLVVGSQIISSSHHWRQVTKLTRIVKPGYSYDFTSASDTFDAGPVVSHNCRAFVPEFVDSQTGEPKRHGRMNLGVITINLPRVALEAGGDKDEFWKKLDRRLELVHKGLRWREARVRQASPRNAPILYRHGGFARLSDDEPVGQLFDNGRATLGLGYIGLYEVGAHLFGGSWYDDDDACDFMVSVLAHIKAKADQWNEDDRSGTNGCQGARVSVYGTPAEALSGRFAAIDRERFGVIANVTDKGNGRCYYENSFQVDSRLGIQDGWDPIRKIRFESRFLPYSTGGQIVFTEWPSMVHNLTALEAIWDFAYDNDIYYMGVNFPVDQCFECGFVGEMSCTNQGYCCPKCNNSDLSTINCVRRLCGYLGEPAHRPVNIGKQQQILGRAKHI